MNKEIANLTENEWYQALIEECQAIIVEGVFRSRIELIETYHKLGSRILEDKSQFTKGGYTEDGMSKRVSTSLGKSQRTVEMAIRFAKKFPNLEEWLGGVKEGKNISWHKITQIYLPKPKEEKEIFLPKGKYQIIYADPAWDYGKPQHGKVGVENTNGAHDHYKVMSDEEISNLRVGELVADDCLLFMWTTGPKMKASLKVGEVWGFEYATVGFVWHKQKPNPGEYTMSECEYCLIFRKGTIPQPRGARNIRQFYSEERTKHSAKPAEIRKRIEAMFPAQKKIELFAREKTENWDFWGDEV